MTSGWCQRLARGLGGAALALGICSLLALASASAAEAGTASRSGGIKPTPAHTEIVSSGAKLRVAKLRAALVVSITVSAHRGGAQEKPQNSLEAFQNALAENVGEVEADTWITADGVGVIEHDQQLTAPRCGGPYLNVNISSLTADQVAQMQCDGQPIPTEDQLLGLLSDSSNTTTKLRLEAKTVAGEGSEQVKESAHQVGAAVVAAGLTNRTIMQDFRWDGIAGFHEASPQLRVSALIAQPTSWAAQKAKTLGAYDLSYDARYSTPYLNTYLRSLGLVPTAWNVDSVPLAPGPLTAAQQKVVIDSVYRAMSSGASVLIVNNPALVMSALATPSTCSLVWRDVPDRLLQPTSRYPKQGYFHTAPSLPTYETAVLQIRESSHTSENVWVTPEGSTTHSVFLHLLRNHAQTVHVGLMQLNGIGVATAYPWAGVNVTITGFYARACS